MSNEKKQINVKGAILAACVILFLLLTLPAAFEFSAKATSPDLAVGPSESIQTAINVAAAGDTILVQPGMYNESLLINKTITLIGQDRDQTIINGQNDQFIISIAANNVTVQGFTIQSALNPSEGINISSSQWDLINHNIIENSQQGIALSSSGSNTISNNLITENSQGGIVLISSSNNFFSGNQILNNSGIGYGGLYMYTSGGNVFSGNTFANNLAGERMTLYCTQNVFFHNNFYEAFQVDPSSPSNLWDFGTEGNYWSNYTGHNGGNGIGIESYTVTPNNRDHFPLMGPFSSSAATFQGETYQISVISNLTVSNLEFEVGMETGNKIIRFNATGAEDTVGFSRLTIPPALMKAPVDVLVGDRETVPTPVPKLNSTLNNLYFTYANNNQTILIISSESLDEYSQLQANFQTLNATYYQLLSDYNGLLPKIETLQRLNDNYTELLNNYTDLMGNYTQLQQSYQNLNNSYQQHLTDYNQNLQNVRSLMYIFAAATAVLILVTVYFSKHAYSSPTKGPEERKPILSTPNISASQT